MTDTTRGPSYRMGHVVTEAQEWGWRGWVKPPWSGWRRVADTFGAAPGPTHGLATCPPGKEPGPYGEDD